MAGSFNNFHGRLTTIFYILSDDKVGSTPRFAPGSKADKTSHDSAMEVEPADDEVVEVSDEGASKHTPLRGVANPIKRKAGQLFSGSGCESASKIKPT